MKESMEILFKDASFPIKINPGRASVVDDVGSASRALHEAIEIKYFYEGESTLLIGTETLHVTAGDVVVINPYEVHGTIDYGKIEKGRYHLFMVGLDFFSGATSAGIDLRHLIFGKHVAFKKHFPENKRMQEILTRVASEADFGDEAARLSIFGLMAEFFALLLREGTVSEQASANDSLRYYSVIEPALRMIRDSFSEKFTVDMLADACRMSKYHFCRIFKAAMNMSAIQYLNSYRLKIADAMLAKTDSSVSEVGEICGFEDAGYFARIYKKQFGRTPKEAKNH